MSITLNEARENLRIWLEAERALATAQSYTIANRSLTRANLSEVAKRIEYWKSEVSKLELIEQGKRVRRTKQFIPYDS